MDKLENYRQIVQKILAVHGQYKPSQPEIESLIICDRQNDNYLLMGAGWNQIHSGGDIFSQSFPRVCYKIQRHHPTIQIQIEKI